MSSDREGGCSVPSAAVEMMVPMLAGLGPEPANLRSAAGMSRKRYFCTQLTSVLVTLLIMLGMVCYAVAKVEDIRTFLMLGCNMFTQNQNCNGTASTPLSLV
jgi:hypothetical protein